MSALGSADLQNSATSCLASQTDKPAEPSVLPPFCEILSVDGNLKLSNEDFKKLIENSFITNKKPFSQLQRVPTLPTTSTYGYFSERKVVTTLRGFTTPLSQLTATPPFPTPHILAQFASNAYTDYRRRETDTEYETRLALPDGWYLLTTASNGRWNNGYFGAAYWHPEHQQVVIAHRGTKPTKLGSLWADLFGVMFENHVPQMSSASTFANEVVEVLQEVSRIKRVSFQLFFTGHSLGGWLAQVTTFTTKYLKREKNFFLKNNNVQDCVHPHTVVFDSPGCKDMLSEMTDKLDVRLDGRSID
jgi:hypothetical protein